MPQIYVPTSVVQESQNPEGEISWIASPTVGTGYLLNSKWKSSNDLVHLSNPATGDYRTRTQSLVCTNFRFSNLPATISGIELKTSAQRHGRIVDEIIQLTYQGQPIGENKVNYIVDAEGHFPISNDTSYGGPADLWGADLTPEILEDSSFGVILKFQAHPYYPHKQSIVFYSVSITVY